MARATPEQITRIATAAVEGICKLEVLDGATVLIMALSYVLLGRRDGTTVEEMAEAVKQSIIEEITRLEARKTA